MEELCRVKGLIICFQKGQREREREGCADGRGRGFAIGLRRRRGNTFSKGGRGQWHRACEH